MEFLSSWRLSFFRLQLKNGVNNGALQIKRRLVSYIAINVSTEINSVYTIYLLAKLVKNTFTILVKIKLIMKSCILSLILFLSTLGVIAQGIVVDSLGVAVNENELSADPSAILDVSSNSKGLLIPRLTTAEIQAIQNPADGLLVFNANDQVFMYYSESSWSELVIPNNIPNNETDPVFSSSPSAGIGSANISNWNSAYSWGNHATAGYLTSGDNLGNHTASQNIRLNGKYLSNDGGNEGLKVDANGMLFSTTNLYVGTSSTSAADLYVADRIYDWDNTKGYYLDMSNVSKMNTLYADIFYDISNDDFYLNPAAVSLLNHVKASKFVDRDDDSFYCEPASVSKFDELMIGSSGDPTVNLEIKMPANNATPVFRAGDSNGKQFTFVPDNCGWGYNNLGRSGDFALVWKDPTGSNAGLMIGPHASTYDAFYFSGDGAFSIRTVDSQGYNFYVNGSAGGTYNWNVNSDVRLKQNIQTIDSALNIVEGLRGVYFEWKPDTLLQRPSGRQVGFIAQELRNYVPEVVSDLSDRSPYYTVSYASVTPVLAQAIKELKVQKDTEIEALNNELEAKQTELESLQTELEELRNTVEALQSTVEAMQE